MSKPPFDPTCHDCTTPIDAAQRDTEQIPYTVPFDAAHAWAEWAAGPWRCPCKIHAYDFAWQWYYKPERRGWENSHGEFWPLEKGGPATGRKYREDGSHE